jgi:hypothetical protein
MVNFMGIDAESARQVGRGAHVDNTPALLFQADQVIRRAATPDASMTTFVLQTKSFTSAETMSGYTATRPCGVDPVLLCVMAQNSPNDWSSTPLNSLTL